MSIKAWFSTSFLLLENVKYGKILWGLDVTLELVFF